MPETLKIDLLASTILPRSGSGEHTHALVIPLRRAYGITPGKPRFPQLRALRKITMPSSDENPQWSSDDAGPRPNRKNSSSKDKPHERVCRAFGKPGGINSHVRSGWGHYNLDVESAKINRVIKNLVDDLEDPHLNTEAEFRSWLQEVEEVQVSGTQSVLERQQQPVHPSGETRQVHVRGRFYTTRKQANGLPCRLCGGV